ncbi:MAG: hypothetical protein KDD35_06975, partial [Bdellovibrionales bacterium]|nr:hypothetical protein [Bdellovibrionales bacterium]
MEDEWGDGEDIVLRASNRRFYSEEPIVVGGDSYTAEDIWRMLGGLLTESRQNRILEVCRNRSEKLVTVLENIYDRGNISAVMRTAEAFGFY